jgi:hypothetical protein
LSYIPFGVDQLIDFIENYIKFRPVLKHELIILFNGHSDEKEIEIFSECIKSYKLDIKVLISQEHFDIGSYFYASSCLNNNYVLFLNTYSRFLDSTWLDILYDSIQDNNVGVVGCTGAWSDFGGNHFYRGKGLLMLIYSWIVYRFNFYPYITAHLRTNAFIINRKLFLSLRYKSPKPSFLFYLINRNKESKLKSFCFEHGINSMTNQLIKKGYTILIVGKSGLSYPIDRWKESEIFWTGKQKNLLIQDNQTQFYNNASDFEKEIYEKKAWYKSKT